VRRLSLLVVATVGVVGIAAVVATAQRSRIVAFRVVASNLDNPRKIFVGARGTIYVAEAGSGGDDKCWTDGGAKTCIGLSGSITSIAAGHETRVVTGLPSAASTDGRDAEGAAATIVRGDRYDVLLGDGRVSAAGRKQLGRDGAIAGDLVSTAPGTVSPHVLANFGAFEASHDPDHGDGPGAAAGDPSLDSNPYAMTAYRGGFAVVDAAGNDLLWLSAAGAVSVLAVFPIQIEHVSAGVVGKKPEALKVQSVPTTVAVGPDGALYVGELTGFPFEVGTARIWRVDPGHKLRLYASGFTNISDIAFEGPNLLVLEIAADGLRDARSPGALIRVAPDGKRSVILSKGLVSPTGLAVGNGSIYISNDGIYPGSGPGPHGEVISIPA